MLEEEAAEFSWLRGDCSLLVLVLVLLGAVGFSANAGTTGTGTGSGAWVSVVIGAEYVGSGYNKLGDEVCVDMCSPCANAVKIAHKKKINVDKKI